MCTELTFEKNDLSNYMEAVNGSFDIDNVCENIMDEIGVVPKGYSEDIDNVVFLFEEDLNQSEIGLIEDIMKNWDMDLI